MVMNSSLAFGFVDQSHQGMAGNIAIDTYYELGQRISTTSSTSYVQ